MNGTLEWPPPEDPNPYRDLPGGFWKHLQDAFFPLWIIGRSSMTAWPVKWAWSGRANEAGFAPPHAH